MGTLYVKLNNNSGALICSESRTSYPSATWGGLITSERTFETNGTKMPSNLTIGGKVLETNGLKMNYDIYARYDRSWDFSTWTKGGNAGLSYTYGAVSSKPNLDGIYEIGHNTTKLWSFNSEGTSSVIKSDLDKTYNEANSAMSKYYSMFVILEPDENWDYRNKMLAINTSGTVTQFTTSYGDASIDTNGSTGIYNQNSDYVFFGGSIGNVSYKGYITAFNSSLTRAKYPIASSQELPKLWDLPGCCYTNSTFIVAQGRETRSGGVEAYNYEVYGFNTSFTRLKLPDSSIFGYSPCAAELGLSDGFILFGWGYVDGSVTTSTVEYYNNSFTKGSSFSLYDGTGNGCYSNPTSGGAIIRLNARWDEEMRYYYCNKSRTCLQLKQSSIRLYYDFILPFSKGAIFYEEDDRGGGVNITTFDVLNYR